MSSGSLSSLNYALSHGIRGSIRKRSVLPCASVKALFGPEPLLSGSSEFCCSLPILPHSGVHSFVGSSTTLGSRSNYNSAYCIDNCFFVETITQSRSALCLFRSNFQGFEHISHSSYRMSTAASGSRAASGDLIVDSLLSSCGNASGYAKPTDLYFGNRNLQSFHRASISMKTRKPNNSHLLNGYFIFNVTRRYCNAKPLVSPWINNYRACHSLSYSDEAVPSVELEAPPSDDQISSLAITTDHVGVCDGALNLISGSCYLPHPDKVKTGGEDAHFICVNEQAIGVADGVGGWAEVGVNAGEYARQLMSNAVLEIQHEPKGHIDPLRVLEKAHSTTKAMGSSTACIITLENQGIHAINLGDSGFMVVREGCTIFESPVQQHSFNFTYQLENSSRGDPPSSGQVFTIPVAVGDVIVAGTDGLFDNLYNNEIAAIVDHALKEGCGPAVTAQKITALARQVAEDRSRKTPFSTAAQEAGFRYFGGKLDDITVVVSYITGSPGT